MPKKITRIYTRSGDDGKTVVDGRRLLKHSPLVAVLGELDELNSFAGSATVLVKDKEKNILFEVQNNLFIIGGVLAGAEKKVADDSLILSNYVGKMEKLIDQYQRRVDIVPRFILPGGSEQAARLHLCRVVCRRAERAATALGRREKINPVIIKFLNRLSDLFYVMARWENKKAGTREKTWK